MKIYLYVIFNAKEMVLQRKYLIRTLLFITLVTQVFSAAIQDAPYENMARVYRENPFESSTEPSGALRNMWNKITNFFRSEANTAGPLEKPKRDGEMDQLGGDMSPEDNLPNDVGRMPQEMGDEKMGKDDFNPPFPDANFEKFAVSFQPEAMSGEKVQNNPYSPQVMPTYQPRKILFAFTNSRNENFKPVLPEEKSFKFDDLNLQFNEGTPIVEEFDQGGVEELRKKRFPEIPIDQWQTEKIVEGSEPMEDIDADNLKEEIEKDPYLLHSPEVQPIEVQENKEPEPYETN